MNATAEILDLLERGNQLLWANALELRRACRDAKPEYEDVVRLRRIAAELNAALDAIDFPVRWRAPDADGDIPF